MGATRRQDELQERARRAVGVVLRARGWRPIPGDPGAYAVPSDGRPGTTYRTTVSDCTCPDRSWRGSLCKHMLAVRLLVGGGWEG